MMCKNCILNHFLILRCKSNIYLPNIKAIWEINFKNFQKLCFFRFYAATKIHKFFTPKMAVDVIDNVFLLKFFNYRLKMICHYLYKYYFCNL